jgi:hypothetical protein
VFPERHGRRPLAWIRAGHGAMLHLFKNLAGSVHEAAVPDRRLPEGGAESVDADASTF